VRLADGTLCSMRRARETNPRWEITRSWRLPDVPLAPHDEPLEDYLRRCGFDDETMGYARRAWVNAAGEAAHRLSAAAALQDMGLRPTFSDAFYGSPVPSAGEGDYRLRDGYSRLTEALADGLDVRLNHIVCAIDWSARPVRVTTSDGQVFSADQVLVTLPLAVLQAGAVTFTPALPEWKQHAIRTMQMAPAFKLVYRFAAPIAPTGTAALYSAGKPPMWWTPQPNAQAEQVWLALATGDWARELLALGEQGAIERGLHTLRTEFGLPGLTPVEARIVNWAADPFALGGYSTLPPGGDGLREVLARPVANASGQVLFFAGEATAPNPYASTVHGAYVTGRRAAEAMTSAE